MKTEYVKHKAIPNDGMNINLSLNGEPAKNKRLEVTENVMKKVDNP